MIPKSSMILAFLFFIQSVFFCIWEYFEGRSLWLDEAFLAVNVRYRPLADLFSPLDYNQQFPRFYLALVWFLTKLLVYDAWVLRLLPLFFAIAGLGLWFVIIKEEFSGSSWFLRLAALLMLMVNHVFYQYAADFKQYTGDFFWAGFAYWFAARFLRPRLTESLSRWLTAGAVWAAPILLSNTYALTAMAVAISLLAAHPEARVREQWKRLAMLAGIVGTMAALSYYFDLRHLPAAMRDYWKEYFIQGENPTAWARSFLEANARLFGQTLLARARWMFVFLAYSGFIYNAFFKPRSEPRPALALAGGTLALELLALAALSRYPIDGERQCLFFYPFAVVLIIRGLEFYAARSSLWFRLFGKGLVFILLAWILARKTPELAKHVVMGKHWENINPAMRMLRAEQSTRVVYNSGAVAQIRAFPRLPPGFDFVHQAELDVKAPLANTPFACLEGSFYYLMATPTEELDRLTGQLSAVAHHKVKKLNKHLYFFKAAREGLPEGSF